MFILSSFHFISNFSTLRLWGIKPAFHITIVAHQVVTALTITAKYGLDCNVTNSQFSYFFASVVVILISGVRKLTIQILQFFKLFIFFNLFSLLQCYQIDVWFLRSVLTNFAFYHALHHKWNSQRVCFFS